MQENDSLIYFDTAACGLVSPKGLQECRTFFDRSVKDASGVANEWREQPWSELRAISGKFLEATDEEFAFIPNFSYGIFSVLQAIQPHHKRVLLLENDYPSLTLPFELNNFEVHYHVPKDFFDLDLEQIEEVIRKEQIEVFAVSHVQYLSGARLNWRALGEICKRHGVILLLDVTQSLGADTLSFRQMSADVMIASNYKWMNGGFGSGILCCKKEFTERYRPKIGGFGSYHVTSKGFEYRGDMRSYEPGHPAIHSLILVKQAMEFKLAQGLDQIKQHNTQLLKELMDALQEFGVALIGPNDIANRLGIVCCESTPEFYQHLADNGVRCTFRNQTIRMSVHHSNSSSDIDALRPILKAWQNR